MLFRIFLAIALLFAPIARAAVTFDAIATTNTNQAGGTSLSISNMTVGASATVLIAVLSAGTVAATAMSGLSGTWNGSAMTLVTGATNYPGASSATPGTQILCILNPATGNHTLALSWTGQTQVYASAISFKGAGACGNGTFATGNNASPSLAVTSSTGNFVVCSYGNINVGVIGTPSGTQIYSDSSQSNENGAAGYASGASTVTCSASGTSSGLWSVSGVDVQVSGGTTPTYSTFFTAPVP